MSTAASDMRQALLSAGCDSAQIEEIVSKAVEAGSVRDDSVGPKDIDAAVGALRKSLGGDDAPETADSEEEAVSKSVSDDDFDDDFDDFFKAMDEEYDEDDEDEDEDEDDEEEEEEEYGKSAAFDSDVVGIIAKSADKIVQEVSSEHASLVKSQQAIGKVIMTLAKAVQSQATEIAALRNSLGGVADAVNAPMPPRSVTVAKAGAAADHGIGAGGAPSERSDLMAKAMQEIRSPECSSSRRYELLQAVTAIESGVAATEVDSQYRITSAA